MLPALYPKFAEDAHRFFAVTVDVRVAARLQNRQHACGTNNDDNRTRNFRIRQISADFIRVDPPGTPWVQPNPRSIFPSGNGSAYLMSCINFVMYNFAGTVWRDVACFLAAASPQLPVYSSE